MYDNDELSVCSDDSVFCSLEVTVNSTQEWKENGWLNKPPNSPKRRASIFDFKSKLKSHGSTTIGYQDPDEFKQVLQVQYENTYEMEPRINFPVLRARATIAEILAFRLTGMTYDPVVHSAMCKVLAQEIKERLNLPQVKRYKLVSFVSIGEKKDHDMRLASRCLWDTQKDCSASASYQNSSLYAVGVIYAIYYE